MKSSKKFWSDSILSLIDQGLLSALNFLVGISLIRLTSKETYGLYVQLYAGGLFLVMLLDSSIGGPLTTVASGVSNTVRTHLRHAYWRQQLKISLLLAVLVIPVGIMGIGQSDDVVTRWGIALTFASFMLVTGLREYCRTIGFVEHQISSILKQDVAYVVLVVIGFGFIHYFFSINLIAIFTVLTLASFLSSAPKMWHLHAQYGLVKSEDTTQQLAECRTQIIAYAKWALPGAMLAWMSNYSYVYLSGLWLGVVATADLNAARLLLMPIPLAVVAWSRIARPTAGRLIATQDWRGLNRLTLLSILMVEVGILFYVSALVFFLPWLNGHVFGAKYQGLDALISIWGVYFAFNSARCIGTVWLTSGGAFRALLFMSVSAFALVLVVSNLAIPHWGRVGAIMALIVVELYQLVLVWSVTLPRLRRTKADESAKAAELVATLARESDQTESQHA